MQMRSEIILIMVISVLFILRAFASLRTNKGSPCLSAADESYLNSSSAVTTDFTVSA